MDGLNAAGRDSASSPGWRGALPWWAKISAKLFLSRLPVSGRIWQKLGVFSPGFMLDADYAIAVFRGHFERAGRPAAGFTFLELGPGDSLATAAVAWAHGASAGWLVDAGAYAARDISAYRPLFAALAGRRQALNLPRDAQDLVICASVDELLARTQCTYREDGLAGLRAVPAGSIDLVLSQATLEHVPRREFEATMRELHRLMKPGAVASHRVDFQDHLGGGLHNLRFSEALWERPWFARRSGFYTNRLRLSEVVAALRGVGFSTEIAERRMWDKLPLARGHLARQFRSLSDDDLKTSGAALIARKNGV